MKNKVETYAKLVEQRKLCSLCQGLRNPSKVDGGRYDHGHIGPWSLWQGSLNAEVVVVGQDWGDVAYFRKWKGKDQPYGNPTNENLQHLLKTIGIVIEKPHDVQNQIIFLTNIILCLKTGGLQARVKDEWLMNCARNYFKPMIDIINPKVIISLGKKPCESILSIYGIKFSKSLKLSSIIIKSPYALTDTINLFPVYHCGAGSTNRNRSFSQQLVDWAKIRSVLVQHFKNIISR
jgi:uracil-DNA glycosylase family 4